MSITASRAPRACAAGVSIGGHSRRAVAAFGYLAAVATQAAQRERPVIDRLDALKVSGDQSRIESAVSRRRDRPGPPARRTARCCVSDVSKTGRATRDRHRERQTVGACSVRCSVWRDFAADPALRTNARAERSTAVAGRGAAGTCS